MGKIDVDLLIRLYSKHDNWNDRTKEYNETTGQNRTNNTLSSVYAKKKNKDTVINDDTVIQSYAGEMLTLEQLIIRRGLDPSEVELATVKSSYSDIGTSKNEEGRLYNSHLSLTLKPREFKLSKSLLKDMWSAMDIEPITIKEMTVQGKGLLVISLNDVHLWNNTYEDYENHVMEIVMVIKSREWNEILIKQGGDWFHANGSDGMTVAGTPVAYEVSKTKMFEWGTQMITPIIKTAIENANKVKYVYIEGNHDKDMAWSFAWGLQMIYPQVEFDIEETPYKKHRYNDVLLLMAHGDKPRNLNTLGKVMFEIFRKEMATAELVEVHTEHLHHEKVKDDMGMVFRTNPTANKTDKYHLEGGFIGARKIFQCFKYNDRALKGIEIIDGRPGY